MSLEYSLNVTVGYQRNEAGVFKNIILRICYRNARLNDNTFRLFLQNYYEVLL